jgi:hypothetical protein
MPNLARDHPYEECFVFTPKMCTGFYRTQIDSSNYLKFLRNTLNLISLFLSRDNAKLPTAEQFRLKAASLLTASHTETGKQQLT